MARDYKNRSSRKNDAGGRLAGLLTFVAGMVTGLCLIITLYLTGSVPALNRAVETARPQPNMPPTDTTQQTQEAPPAQQQRQTKSANTPTPKFDFYTILPEMEVSVPEWESESQEPAPASETEADTTTAKTDGAEQRYILQIGSFRDPEEAERVKAKLALLGIGTEIQRVVIDGGDVWHRVRAGPYNSSATLNQMRQRLIENDIDFMLLKLKQDKG